MTINFLCRKQKADRHGFAAIEATISVGGKRVFLSLMRKEKPEYFAKMFNAKKNNEIQDYCFNVQRDIYKKVAEMQSLGLEIDAANIKDYIKNGDSRKRRIEELSKEYLSVLRKRIDVNLTFCVYQKYERTFKKFIEIVGNKYLNEILPRHIDEYCIALEKQYDIATSTGYISRMKTFFKWCYDNGYHTSQLMSGVKVKKVLKEQVFLTEDEVEKIEQKHFDIERLEHVQDIFLFQCYTALAYCDMQGICEQDIKESEFGKYIEKKRNKTKVTYTVLLNNKAIAILEKYNYCLPKLSNQKYNSYIKEIIDCCQIKKKVTSHTGRHTAACYMLNNGIPMDIVAKAMGHSSTALTKHYAKLLKSTILKQQMI